ncbi:hypothetical protein F6R98_19620 [Candidatus Methylospira mobilis]|uniref:Uncharacterized protein n=1 Tax=Candidatus Methylospira mobilis TaxID=1808979 RepID=A0A5Q0BN36_9GAMM|nr:hypothetical protein [Candidatus Methylospira mobilis]QFY44562.1 hypothetical protein F6R98_19620 [Candidatus Methylospira mobilis]
MRLEHASPEPSLKAGLNGTQPANEADGNEPAFPSALYFQVHFEYIEKLLGEAKLCLEALTQQVAESRMKSDTGCVDKIEHRFFEQPATLALQCKGKRRKSSRKTSKPVVAGIDTALPKA